MTEIRIKIPYNGAEQEIHIPASRSIHIPDGNPAEIADPDQILKDALAQPVDAVKFDEFIRSGEPLLIVVNDAARPTPTAYILRFLEPVIRSCDLRFLIATGTHRAATQPELRQILGSFYESHRDRVVMHDCHQSSLADLGKTSFGTRIRINQEVMNAPRILVIGSVEPHYFAGFTGGRKGLIPGAAGFGTVEQNHSYAMHPGVQPMKLAGNPVHEDMAEAVRLLKQPVYSIQTVLNPDDSIAAAWAGDIHQTLETAAVKAAAIFGSPLPEKGDIVIAAAAPPLDANLYQAQKAMEHARLAVNPGGILILVSACQEGIGPDHFYRLLISDPDPDKILEVIHKGYRLGYHKAANWIRLSREVRLFGVTLLKPEIIRSLYMRPFMSIQDALDEALKERSGPVIVMPKASVMVPVLN